MNDDYNSGSFDENGTGENDSLNGDTYHYSYRGSNDSNARWEPDSGKYNSPVQEPEKPAKKKHLWWIPVAAVMTVIVLAVVFGSIIGFRMLRKSAASAVVPSETIEYEEIASTETEENGGNDSSGLVINDAADASHSSSQISGVYLTDVSDIVEEVMPAVVSVTSRTLVNSGGYGGFFNFYYGNQSSGTAREVESGIGSGTIVGQNEKELLILTSYHVVDGSSSFYITFCDDEAVDGYIKGVSEEDDIAVVAVALDNIPGDTLNAIRIAPLTDEQPSVGDGAIVIGNAMGYGQSVVTGIISALDRQISVENKEITVIQTDAAINEGNSGGCLLNSKGEIIGISEAKINSSTVEGMCYAISIHYYYDKIIDMLEAEPSEDAGSETVTPSGQGAYLGIYGYDIGSQLADSYEIPEGVYVISTVAGGGAEAAGIQEGDVIIAIDGEDITSMSELQSALSNYNPGDTVKITLMRGENNSYEKIEVKVTLTAAIG